jgi:hypothetical protein
MRSQASLFGAGEVKRVVDSSTDPAMIGAGFYRIAIHSRCQGDDCKVGKNVRGNNFPCLKRINWRRDGSPGQYGVQFGKTVAAAAASRGLVVDYQESGKRRRMVRVAGDGRRHQDGGIEIGFHSPEASLDLLVSSAIHDGVPIKTAGYLTLVSKRIITL